MALPLEYEQLKFIANGSFAAVYKVRHRTLRYIRAVKVLNHHIEDETDPLYRKFLDECAVLLRIGSGAHPNIVRMFNPRLVDHSALVEMDYVEGTTLCDYMDSRGGWMDMDEVMRFADQLLSAMAFCHRDVYRFVMDPATDGIARDPDDASRLLITPSDLRRLIAQYRVIHNDLHSNNVMRRNFDGRYMLLDFGLAIVDNKCIRSTSRTAGAPEFQSPEKIQDTDITPASDVYSLGVLLYLAVAGREPFTVAEQPGYTLEARIAAVQDCHLNATPPDIAAMRKATFQRTHPDETYRDDIPEGLCDIIMRCLEKDPAQRYADAAELYQAFSAIAHRGYSAPASKEEDKTRQSITTQPPQVVEEIDDNNQVVVNSKIKALYKQLDQANSDKERILKAYWSIESQYKTLRNSMNTLRRSLPKWKLISISLGLALILTIISFILIYNGII